MIINPPTRTEQKHAKAKYQMINRVFYDMIKPYMP